MTTGPFKFLYLPPARPVLALHLCFLLRRSAVEVLWAKKLHNTELRKNARAILWVHQLRHWNQIPNAKEKKSRISVWKTWAAGIGSCCNRISENPFVLATANHGFSEAQSTRWNTYFSHLSWVAMNVIKRARGVRHFRLNVKEDLDSSPWKSMQFFS